MTNQTKTTKQQFKNGQLIYNKKTKEQGEFIAYDHSMKKAKVSVIVSQTKDEHGNNLRTTKQVLMNVSDLTLYRKPTKRQSPKYNPNEYYHMVKEFHSAFNHPIAKQPKPLSPERATDRAVWSGEELVEFIHASSNDLSQFEQLFDSFIQGLYKAKEKSMKSDTPKDDLSRLVAQVDALTDESYFNNGSFVELGIKPHVPFKIVQAANMGKLHIDENGKKYAKYRESDGKIQKPENWERDFAPEGRLKAEVERQIKKSNPIILDGGIAIDKFKGKVVNANSNEEVIKSLKGEIHTPPKNYPDLIGNLRNAGK